MVSPSELSREINIHKDIILYICTEFRRLIDRCQEFQFFSLSEIWNIFFMIILASVRILSIT